MPGSRKYQGSKAIINPYFSRQDNPADPLQSWRLHVPLLAALLMLCTPGSAHAKETGVFQPQSLEGYEFKKSWTVDADRVKDGIKETTIEKFVLDKRRVVLKWTRSEEHTSELQSPK